MPNPAFLEANANTDAAQLSDALPTGTQGHFRSILTDEYLRVIGSEGTIYAMGDGATIYQVSCGRDSTVVFVSTMQTAGFRCHALKALLR